MHHVAVTLATGDAEAMAKFMANETQWVLQGETVLQL